jgi:hypothetical protein
VLAVGRSRLTGDRTVCVELAPRVSAIAHRRRTIFYVAGASARLNVARVPRNASVDVLLKNTLHQDKLASCKGSATCREMGPVHIQFGYRVSEGGLTEWRNQHTHARMRSPNGDTIISLLRKD